MIHKFTPLELLGKVKDYFGPKIMHLKPACDRNNGNVLLSYINKPFQLMIDSPLFYSHTNYWECLKIAEVWNASGYAVDVINWHNNDFVPKKDYSFFIDIHSNMERIAPYINQKCKKILHITGAHWLYQNKAEYARLLSLQERRGVTLSPRRLAKPSQGIEFADCATILGNDFTQSTFRYAKKPLYPIPISTTVRYPWFEEKDYDKCRKRFLWIGSSGLVLKGLDLVLEAFSQMPEYSLTICGPIKQEADFERAFFKELYQTPNIRTIGWMDINSPQFTDIVMNNIGMIYPSASEGQAGSVVQCMHAGLIPIISYQSGVDIRNFGITLCECSIDEIKNSIAEISALPAKELKLMSEMTWKYANTHYTREKFAETYHDFSIIMQEHNNQL